MAVNDETGGELPEFVEIKARYSAAHNLIGLELPFKTTTAATPGSSVCGDTVVVPLTPDEARRVIVELSRYIEPETLEIDEEDAV